MRFSGARRNFLKLSVAGTTVGAFGMAAGAGKLQIDMAGYAYDRVRAIADGTVQIEGCDSRFETSLIGELNSHIFSGPQTREISEVGLHPFMLAYDNDNFRDYTLLPIFPLRAFRHKSVFIRTDRGINRPEDLRGKRIATPGYSSTSLVWIRGVMQDEYGVTPEDVEWVVSAEDSSAQVSGGPSRQENILPQGLSFSEGPPGLDESDLLESGKVDALYHAVEPRAFIKGDPNIARLFPDSVAVERAYFANTGIFPLMHAVAIRRDVLEENPWLAAAVFNAYSQAKQVAYDYLNKEAWYKTTLPWIGQEVKETRALMGDNFWPYGIETSRKALTTLFRYSYEQGFSSRQLTIEDLFHASGLNLQE